MSTTKLIYKSFFLLKESNDKIHTHYNIICWEVKNYSFEHMTGYQILCRYQMSDTYHFMKKWNEW